MWESVRKCASVEFVNKEKSMKPVVLQHWHWLPMPAVVIPHQPVAVVDAPPARGRVALIVYFNGSILVFI